MESNIVPSGGPSFETPMAEEATRYTDAVKKWKNMCNIARSIYYTWRKVLASEVGAAKARQLSIRFWEELGRETADLYRKYSAVDTSNIESIAQAIKKSSEIMGETVQIRVESPNEAFVRHTACPWCEWSRDRGLEEEDRLGCDAWFASTLHHLNPKIQYITLNALPSGGQYCERRIYLEPHSPHGGKRAKHQKPS